MSNDKIESVTTRLVAVPLAKPVGWSTLSVTTREYVLVEITTADGVVGTGFTLGSRFIGGGQVIQTIVDEVLRPVLLGRDPSEIRALWEDMFFTALLLGRKGAAMRAISSVDIALWDLLGRRAGLPVCDLLGRYRSRVPAYSSGGYHYAGDNFAQELEALDAEVSGAVERGFRAVKIKIGRLSVGEDLQRVERVLDAVNGKATVSVDANNAWRSAATAINALRGLDGLGLDWIEEPLFPDQLEGCAEIARKLTTPIAIGEMENGLRAFQQIIKYGAASILQADVTVVGGFSEWMRIAGLAEANDVALAPHWVADLHVQVGAVSPHVIGLEYFHSSVGVLNFHELLEDTVQVEHGELVVPARSGHGMLFDKKAIERYTVR
ncbi:MAG TPA: mandelate racemase/muconate lactonizing enzyme family protein [Pseudolysinimonas sp.]|jgi:L-alanine-DL-glutamate epimerase-like enolase superfamily enzyme